MACTSPSPSCAAGCRTSSTTTGFIETLDRDHFYDSIDDALAAIDSKRDEGSPEPRPSP